MDLTFGLLDRHDFKDLIIPVFVEVRAALITKKSFLNPLLKLKVV